LRRRAAGLLIYADKKRASKLFDGEEVEPVRLKVRMKQGTGLIGVQSTRAYAVLEERSYCVIPS
jgi:hypothetical protein